MLEKDPPDPPLMKAGLRLSRLEKDDDEEEEDSDGRRCPCALDPDPSPIAKGAVGGTAVGADEDDADA